MELPDNDFFNISAFSKRQMKGDQMQADLRTEI